MVKILALATLFILLGSLAKKLKYGVALVGTLVITMQIIAIAINSGEIDERFWYHFNIQDILIGGSFLGWKKWLIVPLSLLVYFILLKGSQRMASLKWLNTIWTSIVIVIILFALFLSGFFNQANLGLGGRNTTVNQNLRDLGIPPDEYVFPEEIKATPGKNVVVLYLESMELAYFNKKLVHLIPNLKELSTSWNFRNMTPGVGSDWSAASFYTSIYGLPAFFSLGAGGNSIFQKTQSINLSGRGHVYQAAGYESIFLLGKKEFAGLDDMLTASLFTVKSEKDFSTKYAQVPWGIQDIDLFVEAKKELRKLNNSSKPFALHIATVGSHGPNGFYDPKVESIIRVKNQSNLHKMVSATDYLVGDLISFMEKEGYLKNTVVYIMPDHLLMGPATKIKNLKEERSLFLLSNSQIKMPDTLDQIELPRLMLEGAEIVHNANFLSDYISKKKINDYLLSNKPAIQKLNESAVNAENLASGFEIKKIGNKVEIVTSLFEKQYEFSGKENQALCINLDHKFRLQKSQTTTLFAAFHKSNLSFTPRLIIDTKGNKLYAAILYGNQKMVTKSGISEIVFTADDIQLSREWPYSKEFYELPKTPIYYTPSNPINVTSSVPGDPQILTPSQIILDSRTYPMQKFGLYLLQKTGEINYFNPQLNRDIVQLKNLLDKPDSFSGLLVHGNGSGPFNEILAEVGLIKLSNLGKDIAYIAYPYRGFVSEHTSSNTISVSLIGSEKAIRPNEKIKSLASDPSRFIAHAGGSINGIRYTNSLEALDRAYNNGFRLFELDILQTTDGHFVAAHDWKKWQDMAGTDQQGPSSLKQFLANKILNKYTPLDINRINKWFGEHRDAILITDKINDPVALSMAFQFPDRLIMELFTLEAVQQAVSSGVEPMISQQVLQNIGPNKLEILQNLKIRKVAMSRQFFNNSKELCKSLSQNKIQIFLYQLNGVNQINEVFVLHNDLPLAYGMYAEDWKF